MSCGSSQSCYGGTLLETHAGCMQQLSSLHRSSISFVAVFRAKVDDSPLSSTYFRIPLRATRTLHGFRCVAVSASLKAHQDLALCCSILTAANAERAALLCIERLSSSVTVLHAAADSALASPIRNVVSTDGKSVKYGFMISNAFSY